MHSGVKEDWSRASDVYSANQVYSVLTEIGVDVRSDTDAVWLALCPFHNNKNSPSFAINKTNGAYVCFSPGCDQKGSLISLIMKIARITIFPAKRMVRKYEGDNKPIAQQVQDIFSSKEEINIFPVEKINQMAEDFWNSPAHEYMKMRGFEDGTLAHFQIGYSKTKGLVAVPIHDWEGVSVGVVGRTIVGKRFENSKNIPTRKTLFNIHRAKKHGEKVIIVESSMDAMLIHQAGFPCVVATNGGMFTDSHQQLLNRYFNEIIIMTDNDDPKDHVILLCNRCKDTCTGHSPGRSLGEKIADTMKHKRIRWACYDHGVIFPHGAKDAGDMTKEEIQLCVNNSINSAEYELNKREIPGFGIS